MNEHTSARLSQLVSLVTEKVTGNKDPTKPYVGLEHLASYGSVLVGLGSATDSVSANNVFRPGDTLFGKLRPQLRKAVNVPFDGYCSTDILVLRPTDSANARFVSYVLKSDPVFAKAIRTEEGTKMPRCSWQSLKDLYVFCPESQQQRRIAEILSTLDETIEQTEVLIAKYQQIKKGLMHDLFTRGVTPDGKLRFTRAEAQQLYKESPLGWIPKEWEVVKLREIARPGRPHIKTGPFGSSLKIEHWVEEGRPVITIGALGEGDLVESELLFVSDVTARRLREYQLESGDIVFSRVADVGRSAVIREHHAGWIMSSNLMRISVDSATMRPEFLQSELAYDPRIRAQIRGTVNAGGRDVANSDILNRLNFARPDPNEQDWIMNRVYSVDAKRQVESAHLSNLIKLKRGLMHDLLTGRVRVKVAESEAA